jgi:hypothetical protein
VARDSSSENTLGKFVRLYSALCGSEDPALAYLADNARGSFPVLHVSAFDPSVLLGFVADGRCDNSETHTMIGLGGHVRADG